MRLEGMRSSFSEDDVILLLKDITGMVEPLPAAIRERRIQEGIHYSEMLPLEYRPTAEYIKIYENALKVFGQPTADAVARVADRIISEKGKKAVLVSLARAGTPIGILIKRFIRKKYGYLCPHYSVSIIRDRGIDDNAVNYILRKHPAKDIQFIDGWTGKGVIYSELRNEICKYEGVSDRLAVLADPANLTDMCGTHEDILIPSSCLNSTVCGLISRTVLRKDIIGKADFHGSAYYGEYADEDRTYEFIESIEERFAFDVDDEPLKSYKMGMPEVRRIAAEYHIDNFNYIKPGIGETTRVLLRRIPWKVLINKENKDDIELAHVVQLAKERDVSIEYVDMNNYKCCGLIRQLADV